MSSSDTNDAVRLLSAFVLLQGRLVRTLLDTYKPKDRERFRDVPRGTMLFEGKMWTQYRHGVGVIFESPDGVCVNAHQGMTEYPEGVDGGRLFEYLESLGIGSVIFDGREYTVDKVTLDGMLDDMVGAGLLRPAMTKELFPHQVFVLVGGAKRAAAE